VAVALPTVWHRQSAAVVSKIRTNTPVEKLRVFGADIKETISIPAVESEDLGIIAYLSKSKDYIDEWKLPLSAKLLRKSVDAWDVTVPTIKILSLEMDPTCAVEVKFTGEGIHVYGDDAYIEGSHHVEDLAMNDRFAVEVDCKFFADGTPEEPQLTCTTRVQVTVDAPPPFNKIPRRLISATTKIACGAITRSFQKTIAEDYQEWASSAEVRKWRDENLGWGKTPSIV